MPEFSERRRRKPGASGRPVRLADGQEWLLAIPRYQAQADGLTCPLVDRPTERIFECLVGQGAPSMSDVWEAAVALLRENYELNNEELSQLLSVSPGEEEETLRLAMLELLFGSSSRRRSYGHWVRASLLASGLGASVISVEELPDVLSILVATNRTVPLVQFVDVCREAQLRVTLDALI